jgi:hypothetical protein
MTKTFSSPGRVARRAPGELACVRGDQPMLAKLQAIVAKGIVVAGIAALALIMPLSSASAQNLFESLFGRFNRAPAAPSATAYADPFSAWNPFGSRPAEAPQAGVGGGVAYCVRLCDGRFFPIQRHGNQSPAQACGSFCPATQTRIYNGSSIDDSVGPDGRSYRELSTAFAYREKIVPGCTCNGKDAFGLVNPPVEDDPTLRPGDVVATNNGLMAYNGGTSTRKAANFTPVASYSGLSGELRRRLSETKITPAAPPAAPAKIKPSDAPPRTAANKRVQVDR